MLFLANGFTGVVALLQFYFMILEMFLWQTPKVKKAFQMDDDFAKRSATLAKNQGLYNGFLAAGLVWGLVGQQFSVKLFFLICVYIAGVYGAATANKKILFVQALPAFLALVFLILSV